MGKKHLVIEEERVVTEGEPFVKEEEHVITEEEMEELLASCPCEYHDPHPRPRLYGVFEKLLFYMLRHTHWFSDAELDRMSDIGKMFFSKWNNRTWIDYYCAHGDDDWREHFIYEPQRRFKVLDFGEVNGVHKHLRHFVFSNGEWIEVHCIQCNIRANNGQGFAAYVYRPLFYWEIIKSLFRDRKTHREFNRMAKESILSLNN
jgi:hypothetical protein